MIDYSSHIILNYIGYHEMEYIPVTKICKDLGNIFCTQTAFRAIRKLRKQGKIEKVYPCMYRVIRDEDS